MGVIRTELGQVLPAKEYAFVRELLEAYFYHKAGGSNNTGETVKDAILVVQDFIAYCGKAPWNLTEADFNRWCFHLGRERGARPSTQRKYQGAVHSFYSFLTHDDVILTKLRMQFQVRPRQIVHEENRIPHTVENEDSKVRADVVKEDIDKIFDALDVEIRVAYHFRAKSLYPYMRDKALFYLIYSCGLRASEALGLNTISYMPNPEIPEFGEYGILVVYGKGCRGSGLRRREIIVDDPRVPILLDWYLKSARPHFMHNCTIGEKALFLSQRGRRLSLASLESRFQILMRIADVTELGYVPHCLRHSSVTEKIQTYTLEATRRMHGHINGHTTQKYAHVPDKQVADEITRQIRENIKLFESLKGKGGD